MHKFVRDPDTGEWNRVEKWPRWFEKYQHGFSLGRNKADHWYWSVGRRTRAAWMGFEFHNYPPDLGYQYCSDTIYIEISIAHPRKHAWWATQITVWPPEQGRLCRFLRPRFKAVNWYWDWGKRKRDRESRKRMEQYKRTREAM